ncbi:quinone-dependent dihydroorotate dehydrogenase [Sphingomonas sp.]|uniref:quinone-dependent dihydroorotate dehydrogenase n=1 Tax=Sphingomonas sp. TaxID=28214 RepID=UPI00286B0CEE|nr:quinone-dependent dihydroorotate dehydrogenase [Sphingomonas sp.]
MYRLLRPLVFRLDAERAHRATIAALKLLPRRRPPSFDGALTTSIAGLGFPSPVGLAAGFDKDSEVAAAMLGLGFGFVEVGTLTPCPQDGNPKPRLFRLVEDQAVINRLGFNNRGQTAAIERLAFRDRSRGVVGVNIGANKDSADRIADYAAGVRAMGPLADYLAVNISSPNTPGLRDLQAGGELIELLAAVSEARLPGVPVFLKVAPDLAPGDHERIVRAAIDSGIDALIVANTTLSRPPLVARHAAEAGGLSGAPLRSLALDQLRAFRAASGGQMPLIAAGGIASAEDAWARIRAGASLVQLYSALVYHGPGLARRIATGLTDILRRKGIPSISDAVGTER